MPSSTQQFPSYKSRSNGAEIVYTAGIPEPTILVGSSPQQVSILKTEKTVTLARLAKFIFNRLAQKNNSYIAFGVFDWGNEHKIPSEEVVTNSLVSCNAILCQTGRNSIVKFSTNDGTLLNFADDLYTAEPQILSGILSAIDHLESPTKKLLSRFGVVDFVEFILMPNEL